MRTSQVTFFIIIAVFLIVIVTASLVIVSSSTRGKVRAASSPLRGAVAEFTQFNSYMQSCLDSSFEDALYQLGRQGGFFFDGQPGSLVNFSMDMILFEDHNITVINDRSIASYVLSSPDYPCLSDSWRGAAVHLRRASCSVAYNHLMPKIESIPWTEYQKIQGLPELQVPLCREAQNITNIIINERNIIQTVCRPSSRETQNYLSFQNQMESYIHYRIQQCYDDAYFYITDQMDAEVISQGLFDIRVTFGDEYTSAILRFPLKLRFPGGTVTESFEFYTSEKVRLRPLYAMLYGDGIYVKSDLDNGTLRQVQNGIIDFDFRDILFDVEEDGQKLFEEFSLFNVSLSRISDSSGALSIIRLIDFESELMGQPYQYDIAVRNRRPALDHLSSPSAGGYDFFWYENSSLELYPEAHDLDDEGKSEKELSYIYEVLDENWKWREPFFTSNSLFLFGRDGGISCQHSKYGLTTKRCTKFRLNSSDVGEHRIKITVEDSAGLEDYQIVSLAIDRKTNLNLHLDNIYGIPAWQAIGSGMFVVTDEDPFLVNASGSVFSLSETQDKRLSWVDTNYGSTRMNFDIRSTGFPAIFGRFFFRKDTLIIVHPGYQNYTTFDNLTTFFARARQKKPTNQPNSYVLATLRELRPFFTTFNINKKLGYPVSLPESSDVTTRSTNISLTYHKQPQLERITKDAYIAACFPYRSETPSYPYNLVRTLGLEREFNPYLTNHTCCLGDPTGNAASWRVAAEGTTCYDSFEVGTYDDFMTDNSMNISLEIFSMLDANFVFGDNLAPFAPAPQSSRDRYVRFLHGECNGDRGNVCYPKNFSIQKLPYCGYNTSRLGDNRYNNTIAATKSPPEDGFFQGGLCICADHGQSLVLSISNTSLEDRFSAEPVEQNKLYCCFNSNGQPYKISDKPCVIPECAKYDIQGTTFRFSINQTSWSANDNNKLAPYCRCGNTLADNRTDGKLYCCNPTVVSFSVMPRELCG